MNHLTKLFKLLELTRAMPQYGYIVAGLSKHELSGLAEHHYLVTMLAWQLARQVNLKGAKIDVEKVLEYCLLHDLGELFGGDIAMPYARKNPEAKKLSRAFEHENIKFLAKYFGSDENYITKLATEVNDGNTDESAIAMIADILECTHFKLYKNKFEKLDLELAKEKTRKHLAKIKDKIAKKEIGKFLKIWEKELPKNNSLNNLF